MRCLSLALFAATACLGFAKPFVEIPGEQEFSGELIVRPAYAQLGTVPTEAAQTAAAAPLLPHLIRFYPETGEYVIRVPAGSNENAFSQQLMATGMYQYAEPNWTLYPNFTPNDPQFGSQWHHVNMESQLAWDITFGVPSVTIAVTDTGVLLTHQDLAARLVPGFNSVDDLPQVSGGQVNDINGHGTHVAGCAAAIGNNGVGVSGVAGNVRIMPIRVSNSTGGGASITNILEGARWAAENGAKVVSSSYSGVTSTTIETSGAYIRGLGAIYMYAAGNNAANLSGIDYPNVVVVGATDSSDARASFTGFGLGVDVYAPGVGILSTTSNGGYGNASGTSMATPVANGVAALIWSANPSLSADQVEQILFHSSQDLGPLGEDIDNGWGRVNSRRAVNMALNAKMRYYAPTNSFWGRVQGPINHPYAVAHAAARDYYGLNGHLATMATSGEASFLSATYSSDEIDRLRLGATQPAGSPNLANWSWITGEAWSFTNWAGGEPNNSGGNEDSLMTWLSTSQWNDVTLADTFNVFGHLVEYPSSPVSVTGNTSLQGLTGSNRVRTVEMIMKWDDSAQVVTQAQFGNAVGPYTMNTSLRGPVSIRFTSVGFLAKRVPFVLSSAGQSGVNANLLAGDANGDNEVGPADFALLAASFGSFNGDGNFDWRCDFNNDGEVGPVDFALLAGNFGLFGDD